MKQSSTEYEEELTENVIDLLGDILSIECLSYYKNSYGIIPEYCNDEILAAYQNRIKDYLHQHMQDINFLCDRLLGEWHTKVDNQ